MTNMRPDPDISQILPHRRMEAWKWTDVSRAVRADVSGLSAQAKVDLQLPSGVNVSRETLPGADSPMGQMVARFAGETIVLEIDRGTKIEEPVRISVSNFGHARIKIRLAGESALAVEERYESDRAGFSNVEIAYDLAAGAKLSRTVFHNDHADTTRIVTANMSSWAETEIHQYALSFGAGLSRLETRLAVMGEKVRADLHGAYLLSDKRHCDMTSYIDLGAEAPFVRQSVKGVVTDKATGVFQGKFHVRRTAQLTDAEMRHDAIMLSDTSHVRAKPELEIYADDVACAHGNTVGQLDESALFYMRQRGIPLAQARALLIRAFVAGSFDGLENNADFLVRIENWLEAAL